MAAAAKKLLEAAALDPRNERFVLVGDTTGGELALACTRGVAGV